MIARMLLQLPYSFSRSIADDLAPWECEYGGYCITIHPPYHREGQPVTAGDEITIDGAPGMEADLLVIDFHKHEFDRRRAQPDGDPPTATVMEVVNLLLRRLRSATQAPHIKPLPPYGGVPWTLEYLDDDGERLAADPELIRRRGVAIAQIRWALITDDIWTDVQKLPLAHEPLPWETLILDAKDLLPEIGPAIVLAQTAIETMIAIVLDKLAQSAPMPDGIWEWINDRDFWLKEPSTEDRLTHLLKSFTGRSLADDRDLWTAFRHLRKARNSFAHSGTARIGDELVTPARAAELVGKADAIIEWLEQILPGELCRYKPTTLHQVTVGKGLLHTGVAEDVDTGQQPDNPASPSAR